MQASQTTKLLWDDAKFAKSYSSAERLTGVYGEHLIDQAGIPTYPLEKPLVILDNACGTGVVTQALQNALKSRPSTSFEVTCGDLADAMLVAISERVKACGWTNTKVLKVDAQDTQLPSDKFTHIFTNFGPMLFPNASAMLSECHRMLQPQGICAFTTWKKVGWMSDVRDAFESLTDLPSFPSEDTFASAFSKGLWNDEGYISEQLMQHGFENVTIRAVPNTSAASTPDEFLDMLQPILAIVYRFWSEEDRKMYANQGTEARIRDWFKQKYANGPVQWDWIALVTTSNKSS